jgi:bisphosphoglycerate-independent phosphoglycerate mutase (AlkP superfamily)
MELSTLQFQARTPWDETRHDHVTLEMALEYMRTEKPRAIYITLGETDDWAHDRRYDRVLNSIQYFDEALRKLWEFVERTPGYRGTTSIVVTSDHGRGATLQDYHGHGVKIAGAEQIWIGVMGPDTPARGELSNTPPAFQRDVAPTILDLMGINYQEYQGVLGTPIAAARQSR